jgi:elongation factor G
MKVFTVLGPSGSGKTTLIEALAGLDGSGGGSADVGGVGVRSFSYLGEDWTALEVPGGGDTLALAGPALAMSDTAVICVPADEDAAVLAAPYLRLIEEAGIPCDIFVNRIDSMTGRVRDIVAALQTYCSHHIVLRQIPIREGGTVTGAIDLISERAWQYRENAPSALIELPAELASREREARSELLESLADFDDHLLEQLIEDQTPMTEEVFEVARRVLQDNDLVSAFLGSASHGNGVTRLMKSLRHEAPGHEALAARLGAGRDAVAVSGPADIRKHLGKVVLIRALSGEVTTSAPLGGETMGALTGVDGRSPVKSVAPGDIGLAAKSDHLAPARIWTASGSDGLPPWAAARPPMVRQILRAANDRDDVRLSTALGKLQGIDHGLVVEQDETTGNAVLAAQGPLHARQVVQRLRDDFGIETVQHPVPPAFRETVTRSVEHHHRHRKQSGGAGQFADVVIALGPEPRGGGFRFEEVIKGGAVPRNYIPAVEAGAVDGLAQGPNGYPVVDVRVTLKDGKHHAVDSSDYAFRTAGRNAVKEALQEIGTIVLQPILKVEIHVPSTFAGGLVPTVSGNRGQVLGFEAHPAAAGWDVFSALLPAAALDDLLNALGGSTRGTAWLSAEFDHFEEAGAKDLARADETAAAAQAVG